MENDVAVKSRRFARRFALAIIAVLLASTAVTLVDLRTTARSTGPITKAPGGPSGDVRLARDATIDGYPCHGSADATFFRGALLGCVLQRPTLVRGVPCLGRFDLEGGVRCRLASRFVLRGIPFERGTIVSRGASRALATVGSRPPPIRVFGRPLDPETTIRFSSTSLEIDVTRAMAGCTLWSVRVEAARVTGRGFHCTRALPLETVRMASSQSSPAAGHASESGERLSK